MDRDRKRLEKHFLGRRSPEEQKRLKEHARKRRSGREERPRERKDWRVFAGGEDEPDEPAFERIRRAQRLVDPPRADAGTSVPPADVSADSAVRERPLGVVVSVARAAARVRIGDEECDVGFAPDVAAGRAPLPAVGDEVRLERLPGGKLRLGSIEPRRSVLSRPDPAHPGRERVVAANVDVGVVVLAAVAPKFGLVDRALLALGRGGIETLVCVNKIDLVEAGRRARVTEALAPYREMGLVCLATSAESGEGLEALAGAMAGRAAVLLGHSGVGKSSLANALAGSAVRETGAVRASDGKGRHTTSSSRRICLPGGTFLIDTPGVRAFGLAGFERSTLRDEFPELVDLAPRCRFRDCLHDGEPGCAVPSALAAGSLTRARLGVYRRILAELT